MHRIKIDPRPDWQKRVEKYGLHYHTLRGEPYWDESAAYQFTAFEVDTLEAATNELHEMCMNLVQEVIDERMFGLFLIPKEFEDYIIQSWEAEEPSIYGRFDLAYDGVHPPVMLEYNADTPTALVEASVAQWYWLKDIDERGDQFNSIHEKLLDAWRSVLEKDDSRIHFAAMSDAMEDYITVEYLRDTAIQAGFDTEYINVEAIAWNSLSNRFVDTKMRNIQRIFKLYPWEWLIREEFGKNILRNQTHWIEPAWKMILSNKAILPLLHERHPDCPYLVPASFQPLTGEYVRKPLQSREGANVTIFRGDTVQRSTEGVYGEGPFVYQQLIPIKPHDDRYPVIGSWVVNGVSCGIGIREDDSPITQNTSRFVPHQMV
ncbi:glutathionylspermidine synthase family protein [Telmatocola sphagniphila]|uniref:Glutathionylspermidine synthase family protein n=2 Tax=Telmatocola sphagniphila TaxID=1123043 RepID=A0A8E6BAK1_9BACT|nr:glutathionylspermidine synthase family protein [Telmatocola sphagniphila]